MSTQNAAIAWIYFATTWLLLYNTPRKKTKKNDKITKKGVTKWQKREEVIVQSLKLN